MGASIQGHTMYSICRKLKLLEIHTMGIQRKYSSVEVKLKQIKEDLKVIQQKLNNDHLNPQLIEQEKKFLILIEKWDDVLEKVLRQKSRAILIKHGDSNTKYFHAKLKARQSGTAIVYIGTAAANASACNKRGDYKGGARLPSDKAPGIYGYLAEFFKENWQVIGEDVIQTVTQFFETRKLLREINCTIVTLIPKVANPNYVKKFRPIAC
ncbi:PREDICTED: uncharacterized protein LOC109217085 [Nicotiana attenuata]|uniref:uncharacterized protein LOC109217085 n=1 Tax=Nicotiana attenuata TaxID=49451 RepID=UPI000905B072|nr:PREDICTED: uncharacterized protein LOC109217085 [Nicotiana attenuata]